MDKKDQNIISIQEESVQGANSWKMRWDEMTRDAAESAPRTVSVLSTDYMESVSVIDNCLWSN